MLSLFPLGLVLLPGELLPLHIFEERYKRLIAACRESGEAFGIVLHGESGMAATGCAAHIVAVLEEFPDGRSNIVVRGGERFRVTDVHLPHDPEDEALSASVEYLEYTDEEAPAEVRKEVERLYEQVLALTEADEPAHPHDDVPLSFRVAVTLELDLPLKQRLLQLSDEGERLALLAEALRLLVPRLEVWRSREDAIRGNGKGY